ncbi:MAG TPA: hypothetical protein PKN56_14960, partial [Leptospiraceae bacterium]|nr:hypothetical protein [Leptospiraceae bacterium]
NFCETLEESSGGLNLCDDSEKQKFSRFLNIGSQLLNIGGRLLNIGRGRQQEFLPKTTLLRKGNE